jgi:predicted CopG family antitoxin
MPIGGSSKRTYTLVYAVTKSVRLEDDVYEIIEANKREDETFSEAIERLVDRPPLLELAGILSDEEAEKVRDAIESSRKASAEDRDALLERFDDLG